MLKYYRQNFGKIYNIIPWCKYFYIIKNNTLNWNSDIQNRNAGQTAGRYDMKTSRTWERSWRKRQYIKNKEERIHCSSRKKSHKWRWVSERVKINLKKNRNEEKRREERKA